MQLCYQSESAQLWHGNAADYTGRVDLILTQFYSELPDPLWGVPCLSVVSGTSGMQPHLKDWNLAGVFNIDAKRRQECKVYAINVDDAPSVDLSDLYVTEEGWFPLDVPRRLLAAYAKPGMIIWDGFMGRGTVGKAALELDMQFVGIDHRQDRVEMARDYLNL